jgi:hypothetical protein
MKVAYVSGPYTNKSRRCVLRNIGVAEHAAMDLWHMGYAVICPHLNTQDFEGKDPYTGKELTYKMILDGDLALVERCDVVIMLEGWEQSRGATREYQHAKDKGILVLEFGTSDRALIQLFAQA